MTFPMLFASQTELNSNRASALFSYVLSEMMIYFKYRMQIKNIQHACCILNRSVITNQQIFSVISELNISIMQGPGGKLDEQRLCAASRTLVLVLLFNVTECLSLRNSSKTVQPSSKVQPLLQWLIRIINNKLAEIFLWLLITSAVLHSSVWCSEPLNTTHVLFSWRLCQDDTSHLVKTNIFTLLWLGWTF